MESIIPPFLCCLLTHGIQMSNLQWSKFNKCNILMSVYSTLNHQWSQFNFCASGYILILLPLQQANFPASKETQLRQFLNQSACSENSSLQFLFERFNVMLLFKKKVKKPLGLDLLKTVSIVLCMLCMDGALVYIASVMLWALWTCSISLSYSNPFGFPPLSDFQFVTAVMYLSCTLWMMFQAQFHFYLSLLPT